VQDTEEAAPDRVTGALQVFTDYLSILEESGYRKIRVDTWVGPKNLMSVRVGYAGGEWRLHITDGTLRPDRSSRIPSREVFKTPPYVVKFDIHHVLPTVEQLLEATVLREEPPTPDQMDARREMTIRGEE
jgi:hypothetical protein